MDQAGRAEQQRGPADGRADRLGVAVRVSQEPPGQQHREYRHHPGEGAERVGRRGIDGPPGRVAHPPPQRGREHDGHAQGEQPQAVPAVVRVQVARAAADRPGREPDGAGRHHPGSRDRPAGPSDQDHDRIARGPRAFGVGGRPFAVRPFADPDFFSFGPNEAGCPAPACRSCPAGREILWSYCRWSYWRGRGTHCGWRCLRGCRPGLGRSGCRRPPWGPAARGHPRLARRAGGQIRYGHGSPQSQT